MVFNSIYNRTRDGTNGLTGYLVVTVAEVLLVTVVFGVAEQETTSRLMAKVLASLPLRSQSQYDVL